MRRIGRQSIIGVPIAIVSNPQIELRKARLARIAAYLDELCALLSTLITMVKESSEGAVGIKVTAEYISTYLGTIQAVSAFE